MFLSSTIPGPLFNEVVTLRFKILTKVGRYDVDVHAQYPKITHIIVGSDIWLPSRVSTSQSVQELGLGLIVPSVTLK